MSHTMHFGKKQNALAWYASRVRTTNIKIQSLIWDEFWLESFKMDVKLFLVT